MNDLLEGPTRGYMIWLLPHPPFRSHLSENFYSLPVVFGDNPMLTRKRILLLSDWGWGGREYSMNYRGSINRDKLTRPVKIFVKYYCIADMQISV